MENVLGGYSICRTHGQDDRYAQDEKYNSTEADAASNDEGRSVMLRSFFIFHTDARLCTSMHSAFSAF